MAASTRATPTSTASVVAIVAACAATRSVDLTHFGGGQNAEGRRRADAETARGAEQRIRRHRQQCSVETDLDGEPGQCGIGHRLGDDHRRGRDAGDHVGSQPGAVRTSGSHSSAGIRAFRTLRMFIDDMQIDESLAVSHGFGGGRLRWRRHRAVSSVPAASRRRAPDRAARSRATARRASAPAAAPAGTAADRRSAPRDTWTALSRTDRATAATRRAGRRRRPPARCGSAASFSIVTSASATSR